jgi:hypothetical protein
VADEVQAVTAVIVVAAELAAMGTVVAASIAARAGVRSEERPRGGRTKAFADQLADEAWSPAFTNQAGLTVGTGEAIASLVTALCPSRTAGGTETEQRQGAARSGLEHRAAVGLATHAPCQAIEPIVIHLIFLSQLTLGASFTGARWYAHRG